MNGMTLEDAIDWFKENMPEWGYEADIYCAESCYGKGDWICTEPEGYAYKAAIDALEDADKYRWRDPSEKPPKALTNGWFYDCSDDVLVDDGDSYYVCHYDYKDDKWYENRELIPIDIVAWKYIKGRKNADI